MEFRVLGPVEVHAPDRTVELGRPQQRLVLAVLLADAGRQLSTQALIDRVWDDADEGARRRLHVHITRLRKLLPPGQLTSVSGGYRLGVDPDRVDLHRFRRLVVEARGADGDEPGRVARLRMAMRLWQGEPLAGLPGSWAARTRTAWQREYLDAAVLWARAEMRTGDPANVIRTLTELVAQHPMVEPLIGELMFSLHHLGRTADALDLYAGTRRLLADELGIDPGSDLQQVHQSILRGGGVDVDGWRQGHGIVQDRPRARPAPVNGRLVPRQLPADVQAFSGRTAELSGLERLLDSGDRGDGGPSSVVIAAINGMPGVGKTALAVHWAHHVADRFPDGQLYVNLRGFGPTEPMMGSSEALRGFLTALGVSPNRIPAGLDAQASMYRSLVAGQRVLIVLDNARDAEHVRPLLPGTPPAVALVTSRDHLTGLVATEGVHPVRLDLLSPSEARALFDRRLGAPASIAEPEAAERIVTACALLPLALAIAAARARQNGFPLATLAADLDDITRRLDTLDSGDPNSRVHAVFSWSYATLSPPARRLFRLLALHPGPDISAAAAASLDGRQPAEVLRSLTELTRASLLDEHRPGRYTCHDLLHAYALERARHTDPAPERAGAVQRSVSHYVHTAVRAGRLMDPARPIPEPPPVLPGVIPEPVPALDQALTWFGTEQQVLMNVIRHATTAGMPDHTWQAVYALTPYLKRKGLWHTWLTVQRLGLVAARRLGDPVAVAQMLRGLAVANMKLGRYRLAETHQREALRLFQDLGDRENEGNVHHGLAATFAFQGRYREALDHAQRMLDLHRETGQPAWQADAMNVIGACLARLGEYATGLPYGEQAVQMHRQAGDRYGEAASWDTLGELNHGLNRYSEAIACYRNALVIYPLIGERYYEAETLIRLGEVHHSSADVPATQRCWQRAWQILDDIDHPSAHALSERLAALGQPQS
ncbi:AfsR/SARP family transcriptional regulator [Actinoplanes couchii]|uniref:SARP family transcriptional regulator n=1 Tax=Actinoplanes couchii TaxID=403638 RepID=A0ABQ3WZP7_9ACTN|nr:BTAD domain-containing putative transcriptional regulator [Actinoplanes couchii]MDR6316075.1 DNA-binding SARP family transcriptional activator/tetratricopeptide (TPR) repeat protein [Actinoplanes couchii]GID51689.1 SARP family transcriptional regulator [Actinoplanes couchii]